MLAPKSAKGNRTKYGIYVCCNGIYSRVSGAKCNIFAISFVCNIVFLFCLFFHTFFFCLLLLRLADIFGFRDRLKSTFWPFTMHDFLFFSITELVKTIRLIPELRILQSRLSFSVCNSSALFPCNKFVIHLLVINFMELFSGFWLNVFNFSVRCVFQVQNWLGNVVFFSSSLSFRMHLYSGQTGVNFRCIFQILYSLDDSFYMNFMVFRSIFFYRFVSNIYKTTELLPFFSFSFSLICNPIDIVHL